MVANITKEAIAISLFSGAIIALFVFIGTLITNWISQKIKRTSLERAIMCFLIVVFISLMWLVIYISLIILLTETDLHIFGNLFR